MRCLILSNGFRLTQAVSKDEALHVSSLLTSGIGARATTSREGNRDMFAAASFIG